MPTVPLRCECGAVRGVVDHVDPSARQRIVCLCDDCQTFAHAIDRADLLDAHGGTDVCQTAPARIRLTGGESHLACLRLSPRGLMRWYASCCRTPIANSLPRAGIPFASLHLACMDFEAAGLTADGALGPVDEFIQGRFARGGVPDHARARASLGLVARSIARVGADWARGLARPSPFSDLASGAPVVEPRVLSREERAGFRPGASA